MNVGNINRFIEYMRTRPWHTDSYISTSQCVSGMIAECFEGSRHNGDRDSIARWFGLTDGQQVSDIYLLGWNGSSGRKMEFHDFEDLSTAQQNQVVISMAEILRDTGQVHWDRPVNIEDQMAVDSDTDPNDH